MTDGQNTLTLERHMERLGWAFMPTGPNEWQWMKFERDVLKAIQGDAEWQRDLAAVGDQPNA